MYVFMYVCIYVSPNYSFEVGNTIFSFCIPKYSKPAEYDIGTNVVIPIGDWIVQVRK